MQEEKEKGSAWMDGRYEKMTALGDMWIPHTNKDVENRQQVHYFTKI